VPRETVLAGIAASGFVTSLAEDAQTSALGIPADLFAICFPHPFSLVDVDQLFVSRIVMCRLPLALVIPTAWPGTTLDDSSKKDVMPDSPAMSQFCFLLLGSDAITTNSGFADPQTIGTFRSVPAYRLQTSCCR